MNGLVESTGFLNYLLNDIDYLPKPFLPSFESLPVEEVYQDSTLFLFNDDVLKRIISFVPVKERFGSCALVCRKFNEIVKKSVKSVAFYRDGIDSLDDATLAAFLNSYGEGIKYLNFDLFRSSPLKECTQWAWRQQVVLSVRQCPQLRSLDILVCTRHRLRDADLLAVFKSCPQLEVLKIDAQYISGHCLARAPLTLKQLEMEMCYRFLDKNVQNFCTKLKNLKILHMSQLFCLNDNLLNYFSRMAKLKELSLISNVKTVYKDLSFHGFCSLRNLRKIEVLCLEGFSMINNAVLAELCNIKRPLANSLTSLSLAFCNTINSEGIKRLAELPKLQNLNLDGITRNEISTGVSAIVRKRALTRLFLAEETHVGPGCVLNVIQKCSNLRLLDLSNNDKVLADGFPSRCVDFKTSSKGSRLHILTNNEMAWQNISASFPLFEERPKIEIVHLHRNILPSGYLPEDSVISADGPLQLAEGTLAPNLRRGNRYRLLVEAIGCNSENRSDSAEDEENCRPLQSSSNQIRETHQFSSFDCKNMAASRSGGRKMSKTAAEPGIVSPADFFPSENFHFGAFEQHEDAQFFDLVHQFPPMMFIPQPFYVEPSADVEAMMALLTTGSGGAPRPPPQIHVPELLMKERYTRTPRSKRRSRNSPPKPPVTVAPVFKEDDFPPLC
ncbi:unnamed protein product [Caenorhabditis auriculariae]|uniref:F-box domain-containing protein n=1 Tax=Caenorhabditis auriculariae TaxID=2777116 RepID=A0A8S1GYP5_9PELO|nr:unnamed protein product [Caenorhabditis auriculariae]